MARREERTEKEKNYKEKNFKEKKSRKNKEFAIVAYCFLAIFIAMMGHLVYFQVFQAEKIINNSYNKRQKIFADSVIRGDIRTADGVVLATTKESKMGQSIREYPEKNMYAHVVGYSTNGTTGIEEMANFNLLRSHSFIGTQVYKMLSGEKNQGDTVVTTLESKLQKTAYQALGSYQGAVVALDPVTGKILAMVSKPDFDPNVVSKDYQSLLGADENSSVLLNRVTQGSYTPGSTFKIFTTIEYLREHSEESFQYDCKSSMTEDGITIHCSGNTTHGKVGLEEAFAKSCNCAYANIGVELNRKKFLKTAKELLFEQKLPIDYPSTESHFSIRQNSDTYSVMTGSFGQDNMTVSPMHLAMVTESILNDGILMRPYIIDHVENDGGTTVFTNNPKEESTLLTSKEAKIIRGYMEATVEYGTAKALQSKKYIAGGKTGSAQVSDSSNDTHSWFVGYAKNKKGKSIVVAVIVEKQGKGSKYAVPITKKIFDAYFD